jgi:hypothetical protein
MTMEDQDRRSPGLWPRGARVRVRNRFDRSWTSGFEVARREEIGGRRRYQIRRVSDGSTLPVAFDEEEVGPDR